MVGMTADAFDVSPADELNPYAQMRPRRRAATIELSGLDDVDWAGLEDAYGPATAVPAMLRALTSPEAEDRTWAMEALRACILHQGSVYSGSTATVPFLVELACHGQVRQREHIVELLCGLAVHDPAGCLVQGAFRWRSQAYESVRAGAPRYLDLLTDEVAEVRIAAAFVLAFLAPPVAGTWAALQARLATEEHELARASALLAVGHIGRYQERSAEESGLLGHFADAPTEPLRLCAALALVSIQGTDCDEQVRATLDRARDHGVESMPTGFWPWADGDVQRFARVVRASIETDDEVLTSMRADDNLDHRRWDAAQRALRRVFAGDGDRTDDLRLPEELTARQREVLTFFVEHADKDLRDYQYMTARGLPTNLGQMRRFLGLAEPGALDRLVPLASGPRPGWFAIHGVLVGAIDRAVFSTALSEWTPADQIAALDDALDGPYRLLRPRRYHDFSSEGYRRQNDYGSGFIELMADIALPLEAGVAWARQRAADELARDRRRAVPSTIAALVLLQRARDAGESPAEDIDRLIAFDQAPASTYRRALRRALRLLPGARRIAVMAALELGTYTRYRDPDGEVAQWRCGAGWAYLDLADPAHVVPLILAAAAEYDRHRSAGGQDPRVEASGSVTSSLRQRHPPDEPFPRRQAIDILARWGAVAAELLHGVVDATPEQQALIDGVRDAVLEGSHGAS